jgi:hypothetical protein
MLDTFNLLMGRRIQKAEMVHDYLQLWFDNGVVLNIFNAFTLIGFVAYDLSQLVGCEVGSVVARDNAVEIVLMGGKLIRVGMADSDYQGPEAMEYIGVDGECIVWQ